jgi:regulator of sirC expression with transglutaminase-like and TPR domain
VCALLIAELEYAELDISRYTSMLDAMAAGVQTGEGETQLAALTRHLFVDLGFHGNQEAYYDPRNSYLNDVLERRTGIPITLSLVFIEVGRRIGLNIQGVGFPGHFLVRTRGPSGEELILDPFHGGVALDRDELEERLKQVSGADAKLDPEHFLPATKRQVLARMLNNLRQIHQQGRDSARASAVAELLALLDPGASPGRREVN